MMLKRNASITCDRLKSNKVKWQNFFFLLLHQSDEFETPVEKKKNLLKLKKLRRT